jgi:hypothetical protein
VISGNVEAGVGGRASGRAPSSDNSSSCRQSALNFTYFLVDVVEQTESLSGVIRERLGEVSLYHLAGSVQLANCQGVRLRQDREDVGALAETADLDSAHSRVRGAYNINVRWRQSRFPPRNPMRIRYVAFLVEESRAGPVDS